ncbi:MAG: D-glycerate dehydrogenase [Clostridiales bacterium]|nr:D-glycerate dehydrogenase [Clostridiales bacterium]
MATILVTHGIPAAGLEGLSDHEIIMPAPLTAFTMEELAALIPRADAVIAGGKLPGDVIRAGEKLKIIANYGAGYDSVDIAAAAACGVPVTNIPESVTDATAELAIGLMLAVSRRIGEMNLRLRREDSASLFGMGRYMGSTLRGRTLGIIGCGRIGGRVAEMARALGMQVIAYSRRGVDASVAQYADLHTLLATADVISLHCPSTPETHHLLDAAAFKHMKEGVIIINTARGAVIDHDALLDALRSGKLAGAGLDVFPEEPRIPAALLEMDNVVCTPHIGTNTAQTRAEMLAACAQQILDTLAGKRPENIVNGL